MSNEATNETDAHRYEMKEALEGGLISQREYEGQVRLMDEAESTTNEPRVCQPGADGSPGCGHDLRWLRDGVCTDPGKRGEHSSVVCGHECAPPAPPVEDETHKYSGLVGEGDCCFVIVDQKQCRQPADAPVHKVATHVHDFKQIEGQSSLECACGAVPDYDAPMTDAERERLGDEIFQDITEPQRLAPESEPQKCDGNHGGPRCGDPECWNDESPALARLFVNAKNGLPYKRRQHASDIEYVHLEPIRKALEACDPHVTSELVIINKSDWDALVKSVKGESK